jgi:hypothetical protein
LPEQVAVPLPVGAAHAWHVPPLAPVPHFMVDCAAAATQPALVSQQPPGQVAALHATQAPETQSIPDPHDRPSLMLLVGLQVGPAEHDIVPVLQGRPEGAQVAFGVHATQFPVPSHTPLGTGPVWHATPAAAAVLWSVHVSVPPAHDVTLPTSHGLLGGEHEAPTVHALQTPE